MSPKDRLNLIQEIWDRLASEADQAQLTAAQREDLQRRLGAYWLDFKVTESA
jgi:putative addiction module component (TIGR02574 family)